MRAPPLALCAGLALALLLALPGAEPRPAAGASLALPPGFAAETVTGGLRSPRAFAFAPDGRIFIAERGNAVSGDINVATVRVVKSGALLPPSQQHWFDVCGDGERGLLGMALDPQFAANGHLYVYYTRQGSASTCGYNQGAGGPRNRVSRVTMAEDGVQPGSELVLLDNIPADGGVHNAGDLRFDGAGNLYVSTGNANLSDNPAQKLDSLGGKVLRIRPTTGGYSVPADNPFAGAARRCGATPPDPAPGFCAEIFAYGLRNPFRMAFHPQRGELYAFDVGGGQWEEINRVEAGRNYGHPAREGPCDGAGDCLPGDEFFGPALSPQGYVDPIYAYKHSSFQGSTDAAVIGGAFYTGASYPAEYHDNLFFGDFARGWVRRLARDPDSDGWSRADFATGAVGLIGLQTGLDGNLYLLLFTSDDDNLLVRVRYTAGANQAPTARLSASPTGGPLSTTFTFSGTASSDPEGDALRYRWDLGDGTLRETTAPTTTHTYGSPGAKTVTLRVADSGVPEAVSAPATITVYPGDSPPTGAIVLANSSDPARDALFYAGDTWAFHVEALADDTTPPEALAVSWRVVFHHSDHTHPFIEELAGPSGSFTIPTTGETDPNVWYRVIARVTDGAGQTAELSRELHPAVADVTFDSDPPGGRVTVDGRELQTPATLSRVVGLETAVGAPAERLVGGVPYRFVSWTGGAGREFTLHIPPAGGSYTAHYRAAAGAEHRLLLPLLQR